MFRIYKCGLHTVLWSQIFILLRLLAAEPRCTALLLFSPKCLCEYLADPLFDGVGLGGFKSGANGFLLASAARPIFVFNCFPFCFFLYVGIVGLRSLD